jgi:hypothetical protein
MILKNILLIFIKIPLFIFPKFLIHHISFLAKLITNVNHGYHHLTFINMDIYNKNLIYSILK